MIRQLIRMRRKRILIDINTQKDFFLASGKACIRNHRRVLANVRRVMAWARHENVPVISTCQVYPNNNGDISIGYCIDGSEGQKKLHYTLLDNRKSFRADGTTDLPFDVMRKHRQIIFNKRCVDPFSEPRIDRLLSEVKAREFILIGASTEDAVKAMTLGLLQRGKKVTIVIDAVGSHNKRESELAIRKMKAKGAKLIEVKKLAGTSHLRLVGACNCQRCQGRLGSVDAKVSTAFN